MLSIGWWRWDIRITIAILDIIHRPVFHLKHNVSETGFCLRIQVEHTQLGLIDRPSVCLQTQAATSTGFTSLSQHTTNQQRQFTFSIPWISTHVVWRMLTPFADLCCAGFMNCTGDVAGVRRQALALSIGTKRVGFSWRQRHNPVSETFHFK
jgi:hypothetical protein